MTNPHAETLADMNRQISAAQAQTEEARAQLTELQEIAAEIRTLATRRDELRQLIPHLERAHPNLSEAQQLVNSGRLGRARAELAEVTRTIDELASYAAPDGCSGPHCPRY